VAARYNTVSGPLAGTTADVGASRWQLAAGWYMTDNIVLKGEYITQRYNGYAPTSILNGGKFHGLMIEGAVAF
jgi:phosphate-selective porin